MRLGIFNIHSTHHSDGLNICLALSSSALLGVGRRGGFSSHIFLMFLSWLVSSHKWDFYFYMVRCPTPCSFGKHWVLCSIIGGYPSIVCVQMFWKAPKLSGNGSQFTHELGVSPSDILGVIHSCCQVRGNLTAFITALLWDSCPLVTCVIGATKFSEGLRRNL